MEHRFSRRADDVIESFIMKLIAVANKPGMISFATGLPDKRLFDIKGLAHATDEVLAESGGIALQYGETEGYRPLREKIARRCNDVLGVRVSADNVFMTNGSQEAFDHLGKLFIDPGDAMMMENPTYLGALQSFSVYAPRTIGIDLTEEGPDIDQMVEAVKQKPKLFYAIPNHQNPSGVSYSEDSRKAVAEIIDGSDTLMIEDDAYGELGYNGRAGKAISSMTTNTVLTGSYSKIISPGLRVGWMVVPDWLKENTSRLLESSCLHSGLLSQMIIDRFLAENDFDSYIAPIRAAYKKKQAAFIDLMEDKLPDCLTWNRPSGGMFVWMKTPEGTDSMRLYEAALKHKIVIMPGGPFHVSGGMNTIRLNFAAADDDQLIEGMDRLSRACNDVFQ